MKKACLFALAILIAGSPVLAQQDTTLAGQQPKTEKKKKYLKNTIRFNLTNPIFLSEQCIIFGYERVLWNNMSVSVNFGQNEMRDLGILDVDVTNPRVQLKKNQENTGYNFSIDWRFYAKKLNAFPAPRGVYIAPYYSFNNFQKSNLWTLNTNSFQGDVSTDFTLDIHTLGFELGYQFVFWRRVALDFVLFGPGLAEYALSTKLSTNMNPEDEALLFEKINEILEERFPGYTFSVDDAEFKKTGSTRTTTLGFRYMIHLGFRF